MSREDINNPYLNTQIDGPPELLLNNTWQSATIVVSDLANYFKSEETEGVSKEVADDCSMLLAQRELAEAGSTAGEEVDQILLARGLETWRSDYASQVGYALATTITLEAYTANFMKVDLATHEVKSLVRIRWEDTVDPAIFNDAQPISELDLEEIEILSALVAKTADSSSMTPNDSAVINTIEDYVGDDVQQTAEDLHLHAEEQFEEEAVGNVYQEKQMIERAARALLRKHAGNKAGNIEFALEREDFTEYISVYIKARRERKAFDHTILEVRGVRRLIGCEIEYVDLNDAEQAADAADEHLSDFELDTRIILKAIDEGTEMPVHDYHLIENNPEEYLQD